MSQTLAAPAATINRDRWGRPLIIPPDGGKPVAYTRASTLGKVLEEQSALTAWKQRMTLVGATLAPHIMISVAAHRDDKTKLNELAEQAMSMAQAGGRAEIGTALHKLTETIDAGGDPGPYPAEYRADIDAYRQATAGWKYRAAETFVVCDELQVAGTFDRLLDVPGGAPVVVDLKTGGSVDYSGLSFGVQLAVYAHGSLYDPATGERTPLCANTDVGRVVHLPAGEGRCDVYDVDIARGYAAARAAVMVRGLRTESRRWLAKREQQASDQGPADPIADAIAAAPTYEALGAIWQANEQAWTPAYTELAAARRTLIEAGAVATA